MKAKIVYYDWQKNRAILEFEPDFSATYDKYHDRDINVDIKQWKSKRRCQPVYVGAGG